MLIDLADSSFSYKYVDSDTTLLRQMDPLAFVLHFSRLNKFVTELVKLFSLSPTGF